MEVIERIKGDFEFVKNEAIGVLLFGSYAADRADKRSDIDVCLVGPKDRKILLRVFEKMGGKYDVKIFEDLPLYIKMDVIKNHRTVFGDEVELSLYFYSFRKEWRDMEHRIKENRFASAGEMIRQRRARLNERRTSQKA